MCKQNFQTHSICNANGDHHSPFLISINGKEIENKIMNMRFCRNQKKKTNKLEDV